MIRLKSVLVFLLPAILAGSLLAEVTASTGEISLEEIIEKVRMRQSRIVRDIEDAVYSAEALYKEREKDGELKKELVVRKNVYMRRGGEVYEEYLAIIRNGKELHGKEFQKELKDWKKKAGKQQQTIMPMTPEGEGAYEYYLMGDGTWEDMSVWLVGFRAREKKDGYINGKGYVSKDTFDIVRAEFAPAKISRVIKGMSMAITHSEVNGYWIPAKFELDMKIKVGFLVDLFYRTISIRETYSEHKFNNQLEGSLFGSD
jgi:hypothetical protein